MNRFVGIVCATLVALAALSSVFDTWYRIEEGERGIVLRNGRAVAVAQPGLGFKLPLIDRIERISVQTRSETFPDMQIRFRDLRPAIMRLSVNVRAVPDRLAALQADYGSLDEAIVRAFRPRVAHEALAVFGATTAVAAVQDRRGLTSDLERAIRSALPDTFRVDSVQIESLVLPPVDERTTEGRDSAEGAARPCGGRG